MILLFARTLSLALLTTALASVASAQTFPGPAQSVADADAAWLTAMRSGNLDRAMDFLAPDAAVLAPEFPIAVGRDASTAVFKGLMSMPGVDLSWHVAHVVVSTSGDLAFTDGTYTLNFNTPDGKTIHDHGKYLTVWRTDKTGKWRVLRDMFNTDLPQPH